MPIFRAARRVPHGAKDMFELVADVERYPEFVPLCQRHVIRSRKMLAGTDVLTTDMTIAYRLFRTTYRSRVTLDRAQGRILVDAADDTMRRLQTRWTFQACGARSCDVAFYTSYELASRAFALLIGPVLEGAFGLFVQAFEQRANLLYGAHRG